MLFLYEGNVWFIIEKYKNQIVDDNSSLNTSYFSDDDNVKSEISKITSNKKVSSSNVGGVSLFGERKDPGLLKQGTYVVKKNSMIQKMFTGVLPAIKRKSKVKEKDSRTSFLTSIVPQRANIEFSEITEKRRNSVYPG